LAAKPFVAYAERMAIDTNRLKSIVAGSAGNLVEWYDWFAYATFSIYFAPVFFPKGDATAQLLNTAAIFAAGFLMRPIGAWVMGIYGDKHGRKAGLTLSVIMMAVGSLMIAFAPTYAQVGVAAPVMLVVARMIQGLSVGGEYGSSATYLSEMAPADRRGFWSSFQYATLSGGQLLAILTALVLQATISEAQLGDWGWRIPFVIGAMLAVLVYLLRRTMAETKSFAGIDQHREHSSLRILWRDHRKACILVAMMSGGGGLASYAFTTYMLKYLINSAGFDKRTATLIIAAALVWSFVLQPIAGILADRFGRKPLLFIAGIGVSLVAVPVYTLLGVATSPWVALGIILIPITLHGGYTANNAMVKAELFPAHVRALGVAFPYAVGNTLLAGTLEYVALWFKSAGHESGFFWYVAVMVGMTVVAYLMLPETKTAGLIREG
jgi:MFS transporter, MHS family, alpha-ketoglutarate permease